MTPPPTKKAPFISFDLFGSSMGKFGRGTPPKTVSTPVKSVNPKQSNKSNKIAQEPSKSVGSTLSSSKKGLSSLQQQFAKKLEGARFRTINESLYTTRGDEAFSDFQADPAQFEIYHVGFREQAAGWPYNPLDGIINWIKKSHSNKIIADLGCGDARLAKSVTNTVHSFDLVSNDPVVVACDLERVGGAAAALGANGREHARFHQGSSQDIETKWNHSHSRSTQSIR